MKIYELNNLLHKLKNDGEMIEFTNGSDSGSVHFVETTNSFLFMFNAVGIISQKCLRTFRNKLMDKIEQYNLVLENVY